MIEQYSSILLLYVRPYICVEFMKLNVMWKNVYVKHFTAEILQYFVQYNTYCVCEYGNVLVLYAWDTVMCM